MTVLNTCSSCKRYFAYPDQFDKELDRNCALYENYEAVITCKCGAKKVAGGDAISTIPLEISLYGLKYDEAKHGTLPSFDAVMLTACDHDDPDMCASTIHRFPIAEELIYSDNYHYLSRNHFKIWLKPGEPRYIYRNLPVCAASSDLHHIKWAIVGQLENISGILEWCCSYNDAKLMLSSMKSFTKEGDHLEISPVGIETEWSFSTDRNPTRYRLFNKADTRFGIGDTVIIRMFNHFAVLPIAGIIVANDPGTNKLTNLTVVIKYKHGYIARSSRDIIGIVKRSKAFTPINSFKAWSLLSNGRDGYDHLKDLPMYLPFRPLNHALVSEMRTKLSPKKFKRWIRRNVSRIFIKTKK